MPASGGSSASAHSVAGSGSSAPMDHVPVHMQQEAPLRVMTRLQKGIRNPKIRIDGTIRYGMLCISGEPTTLNDALGDPKWKKAMD